MRKMFEFECQACGLRFVADTPKPQLCPLGHGASKRRWSFSVHKETPGHFNHAIGRYVSNKREYLDGLKRGSDEASENTGMEHRFVPCDMAEAAKELPEA